MRPKRLISLLVAVCMMITMLPLSAVTAFAADTASSTEQEISVGDYKYEYTINTEDGTATITKFLGPVDSEGNVDFTNHGPYDINIPSELDHHSVTGLGDYSFATEENGSPLYDIHHHNIHSVTIPESVTSIGQSAFESCFSLDSLIIKDAATSIGASAFDGCSHLTTLSLGKNITTIGDYAFQRCSYLTNVTIPQSVTSIGRQAFYLTDLNTLTIKGPIKSMGYAAFAGCTNLTSLSLYDGIQTIGEGAFINSTSLEAVTIPQSVTSIGASAFVNCSNLSTITIPEKVTTIESNTFNGCSHLESIMLPAGLTSFQDSLEDCPAGNPNGAIYYKNYKAAADALLADNDANSNIDDNDKLKKRNFLYLCKVTFDANGGTLTDKGGNPTDHAVVSAYKTEKINADDLAAIPDPTRPGYNFTGWYTANNHPFNVDEITTKDMTEDITFYARWEPAPKAPVCHPLTLKDGVITSVTVPGKDGADPEDITEIVKKNANEDGSFNVPEGATVSVAFDKDAFADSGLKFGHWDITGLDDPNAYQDKESFDFAMPAKGVTLKAMTQDASIEDDEPDIVGPIVIGTTVVVGGAVLGYQAYSLGAEFAGKLMALPYFPSNRSALAMLLYPDVGQEERDMDLQHAARWAMENELIPDLNDEGTAPEEMKFYPDNTVSKIDVLKAWQKAQELKQNA
ncbi:MAG: leucine-rich repeat protein [Faecalibacterium prausnitzii]|nr:leucine-rich repeat protein [Faecalibacterium prausnitzii]